MDQQEDTLKKTPDVESQQSSSTPTVGKIPAEGEYDEGEKQMLYSSGFEEITRCIVHRHPFGIIIYFIGALSAVLASLVLIFLLAPSVFGNNSGKTFTALGGLAFFVLVIILLILFIAVYIYRQSSLIITNKNVVQVIQKGLFNRKVSQLTMSNVEDVTAEQHGVFATILNFGTLTVETAGEQENFIFPYCPNPNHFASEILASREEFVQQHRGLLKHTEILSTIR